MEQRSALPLDESTSGTTTYQGDGIVLVDEGTAYNSSSPPGVQPWDGWPSDWRTPHWFGRVETLTDTAWHCLDLQSGKVGSFPAYLVGSSPDLADDWLINPNPLFYASWFDFLRQVVWDFLLGEAFIVVDARYATGLPARFHAVPPWTVNVEIDSDGARSYRIGSIDVTGDMIHIPYQITTADAHGHGPLEVGAGRLVAANALARYATNLAASGGLPHSLLIVPGNLTGDQSARLQAQYLDARMAAMGLPGVLSGGVELRQLEFDPEKMALLDLSRFNEARIAELLGVPPPLVGLPSGQDSLTYNTILMILEMHWRVHLSRFASALTASLSHHLLPRGTTIELNRDEYLKPAMGERAQAWSTLHAIQDDDGTRAVTVAEIREAERFDTDSVSEGVLQ